MSQDLVEEPVVSDLGTVIAGVENTVTCSPPGNCPATSLTFHWKKSNVPGIWKKNSSTITFTPSLDDDNTTITCEMSHSKGKTTQKTLLLHVCNPLGKPVISDIRTVIVGVNKTMTCSPPGNYLATPNTFQWRKSNVPGIWKKNSSTITFTPSLEDDNTTITCEMTNSRWNTTQKSILLHVFNASELRTQLTMREYFCLSSWF
ncbi:uncharacterized protein [Engystomops pustulosus]|uniref:uncharacterized protein n=1 Tax=Engystomops pustulosus TaxID=76066 RepID=UPI003AFA3456